jgi:hypothetical protein
MRTLHLIRRRCPLLHSILSREEVNTFIEAGPTPFQRTLLMALCAGQKCFRRMSLRSNAFITVMQTTQLRDLDDLFNTRDLPMRVEGGERRSP